MQVARGAKVTFPCVSGRADLRVSIMVSSSFIADAKCRNGWLSFILNNKAERFNTISALLGAIAAVSGVTLLVLLAVREGNPWKITSFSIYGVTLILVYVFSTLYHGSNGRA